MSATPAEWADRGDTRGGVTQALSGWDDVPVAFDVGASSTCCSAERAGLGRDGGRLRTGVRTNEQDDLVPGLEVVDDVEQDPVRTTQYGQGKSTPAVSRIGTVAVVKMAMKTRIVKSVSPRCSGRVGR